MPRNENRKLQALNCVVCGSEFRARPHDIKRRNRKFCGLRCSTGGKSNGNYKGGGKSWYKRKQESELRNSLTFIARKKLENAIRRGDIVKWPCVICGAPRSEGHHWDYSKPLDVFWLCRKHHVEAHDGL